MLSEAIKAVREEHGLKPIVQKVHDVERLLVPSHDTNGTQWDVEALEAPHKLPAAIEVHTLAAVAEYVKAKVDGPVVASPTDAEAAPAKLIIHVKAPDRIEVRSPLLPGAFAQRATLLTATVPSIFDDVEDGDDDGFDLDTWCQYEATMIALQSRFMATGDRDKLLTFLGSGIRSEDIGESTDNGYAQTAALKRGVHVVQSEPAPVPNPVTLSPYRTFREVEQPASLFVFRIRKSSTGGVAPELRLIEADGTTWGLKAVESCAAKLKELLGDTQGVTILA